MARRVRFYSIPLIYVCYSWIGALPSAQARKTSSLLSSASSCMTFGIRTVTIVALTMRFFPWMAATACLPTIKLVLSMNTATDSTIQLMRLLRLASSSKTLNSCSLISKLQIFRCTFISKLNEILCSFSLINVS